MDRVLTHDPRDLAFTPRDLRRISAMIYARAGIALSARKANMVYGRLSRRLRACGVTCFTDYLDLLESDPGCEEWEAFTNALTTNLTSFFREAHHFPILREHLLARRRAHMTVWCAAASTGEEAYSIAITACEAFGTLAPPVRVIASDIDTGVLATAERGVYPVERAESLDRALLRRYFMKGSGANAGLARVRPEIRALVKFCRINLRETHWDLAGDFDAVFCRNVLIYFDRPMQLAVLARIAPLLNADGLLFAGHSESLAHAAELFRPLGNTVYAAVAKSHEAAR